MITGTAPAQPAPWLPAGWSLTDDDAWHYGNADGTSRVGWLWDRDSWYYLDPTRDGAMATGWIDLNGTWYYLKGSGAMVSNQWVGDYYLMGDGAMATNRWIGEYYVGNDGLWPGAGPGYSAAARFLNIQWAGQPNSYYCGPTSGYMVLHHLGAFGAADGTPLTINNVARFMGTTPAGVFLETRDFERGINRWLGWNAYYTIPHPSYETVRDAVLRSFDTGYPVVVHTWEGNGRYYNGHRSSMGHLMVVDGYDPETDAIYLVDPWAGVSGASAQKFWYGGLREFTNTFINPYRGIYTH